MCSPGAIANPKHHRHLWVPGIYCAQAGFLFRGFAYKRSHFFYACTYQIYEDSKIESILFLREWSLVIGAPNSWWICELWLTEKFCTALGARKVVYLFCSFKWCRIFPSVVSSKVFKWYCSFCRRSQLRKNKESVLSLMANVKKLNPWLPQQICRMMRGNDNMLHSEGPSIWMPPRLWYVNSRWPMIQRGQIKNTILFFGGSQVAMSQWIFYPLSPWGLACWKLGCWIRTFPRWTLRRSLYALRPSKGRIGMLQHPTCILVIHTACRFFCCELLIVFHCFPRSHCCSWRKHTESPRKQKNLSKTWLKVTCLQLQYSPW